MKFNLISETTGRIAKLAIFSRQEPKNSIHADNVDRIKHDGVNFHKNNTLVCFFSNNEDCMRACFCSNPLLI